MQTVPDLDAIDIKMDENASIETIRPNSPLFDSARVTFNDSVEMIQAQEAVDEDQNLKKENCYSTIRQLKNIKGDTFLKDMKILRDNLDIDIFSPHRVFHILQKRVCLCIK